MSLVRAYRTRGAVAWIVVAALVVLLAAASSARGATFASTVEIGGFGSDLDVVQMNGLVEATERACLRNREVEMYAVNGSGEQRFNTDHTSDNGFWGGGGHAEGGPPFTFKARMKPKRLGTSGNRCAGDTDTASPPRPVSRRAAPYPTQIFVFYSISEASIVSMRGQLFARTKCRKDRTVKIQANLPSGRETVDLDHASDNGFWGGEGVPSEEPESARAFAPKKKLSAEHSCAPASQGDNN